MGEPAADVARALQVSPSTIYRIGNDIGARFRRALTERQRQEIVERAAAGESTALLARQFNVTRRAIYRICLNAGHRRCIKMTDAECILIAELARKGYSPDAIATQLGRNSSTIRRRLAQRPRKKGLLMKRWCRIAHLLGFGYSAAEVARATGASLATIEYVCAAANAPWMLCLQCGRRCITVPKGVQCPNCGLTFRRGAPSAIQIAWRCGRVQQRRQRTRRRDAVQP